MDKYLHWPAVHDLALAWHRQMKQAIERRDTRDAYRAFTNADSLYEAVLTAVRSQTNDEQDQKWRRVLEGLAMENKATIRKQLAEQTGDNTLIEEARLGYEKCTAYYAREFGRDSKEYLRSAEELQGLSF